MTAKDIFLAILVQSIWGVAFTLSKPVVDYFSPILMTTIVYAVVATVLTPFSPSLKTPAMWMILIAALGGSVQTTLVMSSLDIMPATTATLLLQLTVPFAVIISWIFGDDRPTWQNVSGCCLALAGVVIVIGWPEDAGSRTGIMLMCLGSLSWAIAQNVIRHHSKDTGLGFYAGMARYAFPQMVLATLLFERDQWTKITGAGWEHWLSLLALSTFGFATGYALWYGLLARNRIDHLLPFTLLMAPIGVTVGVLALGEPLSSSLLAGGFVILIGLAIINWRKSPAAAE